MTSALSSVDRAFEPRSGQTKDYTIGISCFFAMHAALRRKSKYWLEIMIMCPNGATCLSGQTKDNQIGIDCFSAMHAALKRTSKDWLEIMIMCPSGATCLSCDCCFSDIALYKSN